ncbi:MAG: hypothetical protein BWY82_00153 [Verrucomicrobia bacterium ADurb.Bin474]|jgi:hypothetical protein|nr:MAG: hypothetical protein BWY82_00153 [Verrucomicrobia bacterium ADurb.Bin474]
MKRLIKDVGTIHCLDGNPFGFSGWRQDVESFDSKNGIDFLKWMRDTHQLEMEAGGLVGLFGFADGVGSGGMC